jgi:hypothetical protein
LAVPRVRLYSACSARSKGKVNDITRALLLTPPGSEVVAAAEPRLMTRAGKTYVHHSAVAGTAGR